MRATSNQEDRRERGGGGQTIKYESRETKILNLTAESDMRHVRQALHLLKNGKPHCGLQFVWIVTQVYRSSNNLLSEHTTSSSLHIQ